MYLPYGSEEQLRIPKNHGPATINSIVANRDRSLIATVTDDTLHIYLANPQLLLVSLPRDPADVLDKGSFQKIIWRYDSQALAVLTSRTHILIYRVELSQENCYNFTDPPHIETQRHSQELFLKGHRPITQLNLAVVVNLAARATAALIREDLLVCLTNGFTHRISWAGQVDAEYSIRLSTVPFAYDQLQSRAEYIPEGIFVRDIVFAPLIGGYCMVFSDGRAGLLTSQDVKFHPKTLLGVWAHQLRDAVCVDMNHIHRLLIFGCENGDIAGFHVDESSGALILAFRVALKVKDGPEILNRLGPVLRINVVPHCAAFSVLWGPKSANKEKKTQDGFNLTALALFSAYGAQIWSSLEGSYDAPLPSENLTAVEWGPEGLHLWLGRLSGLSLLPTLKSAAVNNPVMENASRILLVGSSNLLLSPVREREAKASAPHSVWSSISPHSEYLASNWPIRFAAIDREEVKYLAIAGTRGLAHMNIEKGKWKIFGNESQEREINVTGGIFIWKGTVGAACTQVESGAELLRFYPLSTKLDNHYCSELETESRIVAMNVREDCLVTFDFDSRILLYRLTASQSSKSADAYIRVAVDRAAEIRVGDFIPHPVCLTSIHVTELTHDKPKTHAVESSMFMRGVDTVLVNVSGKLITLNPKGATAADERDDIKFQLSQPIVIASFVEHIWHDLTSRATKSGRTQHLSNAIWINCGAKGLRVWLPLLPGRRPQQDSFNARRIMLPFSLDIRPAMICSMDCIAVGLESTPITYGSPKHCTTLFNVHRNSEVFIHHILKELLKRNLGAFAIEIARSCRHLPYFPHALELLLHGVLEEEATSSEPIPDPLLPRIVAFIQEFPEFLRTIAHCARKTELALWPTLFTVTGSPNDIFEVCLRDGELQTAASYLIVLQSIENSAISLEQAARLLREALSAGEWTLAQDMLRFASSIDADDIESQPRTPPPQAVKMSRRKGTTSAEDELVVTRFQAVPSSKTSSRIRSETQVNGASRKDSGGSGRRLSKALSAELSLSPTFTNAMIERMQAILREHAMSLLREHCVRDLGFFCSHLNFDLVSLVAAGGSSFEVADFPSAITRLHAQFEWPYPVAGHKVVDHLTRKFGSLRTSQSSISLAGNPACPGMFRHSATNRLPCRFLFPKRYHQKIPGFLWRFSGSPYNPSRPPAGSIFGRDGDEPVVQPDESVFGDVSTVVQEAPLRPAELIGALNGKKDSSGDSVEAPSQSTAMLRDEGGRPPSPSGSSIAPSTPNGATPSASYDISAVEVLCGPAAARGSETSDSQLMHMIRLFEQAQAVDWIFLLCLVRRDSQTLRGFLNISTARNFPGDTLARLRSGSEDLMVWAQQMCPGYLPILQVFVAHIEMVAEAVGLSIQHHNGKQAQKPNLTANGSVPEKRAPPTRAADPLGAAGNRRTLRAAFDPSTSSRRHRERSRSVDRGMAHHAVSTADEANDCSIM
ncbi:unnamed protein product, partial [Mesorhabditis spiculigera]